MRVKLNRTTLSIFALMLILLLPFFSTSTIVVYSGFLICTSYFCYIDRHTNNSSCESKKIRSSVRRINIAALIFIFALFIFQIRLCELGIYAALQQLKTLTMVFIGVFVYLFYSRNRNNSLLFIKGITWFLIVYSVYYLLLIIIKGMPDNRDSVFAFSSNYCAASIYFCYPVLFWYLYNYNLKKKEKNRITVAILVSLIVVLTTGSRTAFGVVAGMAVLQYFLMIRKMKGFIKCNILLIAGLISGIMLYNYNSTFRSLIERAMGALGGNQTVNGDIRIVIWDAAIQQFMMGNRLIGSATNMVDIFGSPRPAHNFVLELLLDAGYIGLVIYIILLIFALIAAFKEIRGVNKFFLAELLIAYFISIYVQPFFSTSFNCGFLFWISLTIIGSRKTGRNENVYIIKQKAIA